MRPIAVLMTVLAFPSLAAAGDDVAMFVDGTLIRQPHEDGRIDESRGGGIELRLLPSAPISVSMGGWFALGVGRGDRRDIFDLHLQIAAKPERSRGDALVPFIGVGLDVLYVASYEDQRAYRGTTMGASAQAGIFGYAGDRLMYRANVGYLGAIVPGTGDDLGGVVLQAGLGYSLDP